MKQKFLHEAKRFNYQYKHSCKKCIHSTKIVIGKKKFYSCNMKVGVFPVSSKFIYCKYYKED